MSKPIASPSITPQLLHALEHVLEEAQTSAEGELHYACDREVAEAAARTLRHCSAVRFFVELHAAGIAGELGTDFVYGG
ncbi:MAG: hypothetical protein F4210_04260 [Holophagales bacterium]|nr:hypothetical protein [Holophagales bacterium]MYF94718.1 hypothetical protein [Holophagales bacterium]